MISTSLSTLTATFASGTSANGENELNITLTLVNTDGSLEVGRTVYFDISPAITSDTLAYVGGGSFGVTNSFGRVSAVFTTLTPSIKNIEVALDSETNLTGIRTVVEFTPYTPGFLVDDPFTENGQLLATKTLTGRALLVKAEANNSGGITELWWNGTQLLNSQTKARGLQYTSEETEFGQFRKLNETGAVSEAWAGTSSSRYIGSLDNARQLLTQTFVAYDTPIEYDGVTLDCSGNIATKQIYLDYIGNPNIVKIVSDVDQYSSIKNGTRSWALNLSLIQTFNKVYTYRPETDTAPVPVLTTASSGLLSTTYRGGVIVANADDSIAVGVFHTVRTTGNSLTTAVVKPAALEAGDPKLINNQLQLVDIENTPAATGAAQGVVSTVRYLCVGTLEDVQNAFDDLETFILTGLQTPSSGGGGGGTGPVATSLVIQSIPSTVEIFQNFNLVVAAVDSNGDIVTNYVLPVQVALQGAAGQLLGTTVALPQNGVATFNNLQFTTSGSKNLLVSSGTISGAASVLATNPSPTLSSISPTTITDNQSGQYPITLLGSGFLPQSVARFNTTNLATTFVSSVQLSAVIPQALLLEGNYPITVRNPTPGGGLSNARVFSITDGTPPVISGISINVVSNNVTITWSTNEPATTEIRYVYNGQVTQMLDPAFLTAHIVSLPNSQTGDYSAFIFAEDDAQNRSVSARIDWSVGDVTPPVITGLQIRNITTTSATVAWNTDEASNTQVLWSTPGSTQMSYLNNTDVTLHVYPITGLLPGTHYDVSVFSENPAFLVSSANISFTTDTVGDTLAPTIIVDPVVSNITSIAARIRWQLDEVATGIVSYGVQPNSYTEEFSEPGNRQIHDYVVPKLTPGITYYFKVQGADPAGNIYGSGEFVFNTPPIAGPGDVTIGDTLAVLSLEVPDGKAAGETYMCHTVVPLVKQSDLSFNWEVDGEVVQREIVNYKSKAEAGGGSTGTPVYREIGGIVAIELESILPELDPTSQWTFSNTPTYLVAPTVDPFSGSGYLEWTGPDRFPAPIADGTFGFDIDISTPGTYTLYIRNRHEDPNPTENNDVWFRVDTHAWEKVFSNMFTSTPYVPYWSWESRVETAGFPQATVTLTAGRHRIEFSGRSQGWKMDKVHLALASNPNATNLNFPQSPIITEDSGINSVECIFPVTVPAGVSAGQTFSKELKVTALQTGTTLAPTLLTGLTATLSFPNGGTSHTADILAQNNVEVLKSGEHCVEYRYYNRLANGPTKSLGVHTYVTYYDPAVDPAVYVRTIWNNSFVDPAGTGPRYGTTGKIYFDELTLNSTGTGKDVLPRHLKYCMTQSSGTSLKLIAFTSSPNETVPANGVGTPRPVNRSVSGIRSEIWPAGMCRVEHLVLHASAATGTQKTYYKQVLEYQNMARVFSGRNWGQNVRWFGPCYMRTGTLPQTYGASGSFGHTFYDKIRMDNQGEGIKFMLTNNYIPFDGNPVLSGVSLGKAHIIASDWAHVQDYGCWTPGFARDGGLGGIQMMQIYEMEPGPGHTKGWSYFMDQVMERHFMTQFHDDGEYVSVLDWYDGENRIPFPVLTGTNTNAWGLAPFFGQLGSKSIHTQAYTFNLGVCDYDDVAFNKPYDVFIPIPDTHIQRTLRCTFGMTNTVNASLYKDLLRYQAEYYLLSEDKDNDETYPAASDNLSIGQALRDLGDPASWYKGLGKWGRNKAWSHFTVALWYMHCPPDLVYKTGANAREHIRDHFEALHTVLTRAMPGGTEATHTGDTNRRYIQADIPDTSFFASDKKDIGATVYTFSAFSGGFTVGPTTTITIQDASPTGGPTPLVAEVVFVVPDAANPTIGRVGIWHNSNDRFNPNILCQVFSNGSPAASLTLGTVAQEYRNNYKYAQTLEMYLQGHMWFAAAEAVFAGYDISKANQLYLYTYELIQAQIDNPEYYNTLENASPGGLSGGYLTAGVVAVRSTGERINDLYNLPPFAPSMVRYNNDTENSFCWFIHVCAAYASEKLSADPAGLQNPALREGLKIGPGPTLGDYEDKIELLGSTASQGSTSNVAEKSYMWAPWAGEVQYQLAQGSVNSVEIEWAPPDELNVLETGGTVQLQVRTYLGGTTTQNVEFLVSVDTSSTAQSPNQYSLPNNTFTIPAGQTSVVVPVIINNLPGIVIGNRTLRLNLDVISGPATVRAGEGSTLINILENDTAAPPSAQFNTSSGSIYEGQPARIVTVGLSYAASTALNVNITISGSASAADYTLSGLLAGASPTQKILQIPAGQTSAQFSIAAVAENPATADAGETVDFALQSGVGYGVGLTSAVTFTIQELGNFGSSYILAKGIDTSDAGVASNGVPQLVSVVVPLDPPAATLPDYYMISQSNSSLQYTCQMTGVVKNASGDWINAQATCLLPNTQKRWSVPGDGTNPAIEIRKGTGANGYAPATLKIGNVMNYTLTMKVANVAETFICKPADPLHMSYIGPDLITADGPYMRQRVFQGTFIKSGATVVAPLSTPSNRGKYLFVVKMIVTERSDFDAATVDIVIENSMLKGNHNPRAVNPMAAGKTYFEWIKFATGGDSVLELQSRPTTGAASATEYWLVIPPDSVPISVAGDPGGPYPTGQGAGTLQDNGMLPGHYFCRRLCVYRGTTSLAQAQDIVARQDFGYVTGPLGYFSGGYGEAGIHLPNWGANGLHSWRSLATYTATKAGLYRQFIQYGRIRQHPVANASWGWAKPTQPAAPDEAGEEDILYLPQHTGWGESYRCLLHMDGYIERQGLASFNFVTRRAFTDEDLVTAFQSSGESPSQGTKLLPYLASIGDKNALLCLPWQLVDTRESSSVTKNMDGTQPLNVPYTTGLANERTRPDDPARSWSLAPRDLDWNRPNPGRLCFYLAYEPNADNARLNWQENNGGKYGPNWGTHSSRSLFAVRAPIYLVNDYVAKIALEYEAQARLRSWPRFAVINGNDETVRFDFGKTTSSLKVLADNDSWFSNGNGANNNRRNRGWWPSHYSTTAYHGSGTPRGYVHPIAIIAHYYAVGVGDAQYKATIRAQISDNGGFSTATANNWIALNHTHWSRVITDSGVLLTGENNNGAPPAYSLQPPEGQLLAPVLSTREGKPPGPQYFGGESAPSSELTVRPSLSGTPAQANPLLWNNPTERKWFSTLGPAYHVAYQTSTALVMLRLMAPANSAFGGVWQQAVKWPDVWGQASSAFVVDDVRASGRRGVWYPSLSQPVGTLAEGSTTVLGSEGYLNRADSEAEARAGSIFWYNDSKRVIPGGPWDPPYESYQADSGRKPHHYAIMAHNYYKAYSGFGYTLEGVKNNFSRNNGSVADLFVDIRNIVNDVNSGYKWNDALNYTTAFVTPFLGLMQWLGLTN